MCDFKLTFGTFRNINSCQIFTTLHIQLCDSIWGHNHCLRTCVFFFSQVYWVSYNSFCVIKYYRPFPHPFTKWFSSAKRSFWILHVSNFTQIEQNECVCACTITIRKKETMVLKKSGEVNMRGFGGGVKGKEKFWNYIIILKIKLSRKKCCALNLRYFAFMPASVEEAWRESIECQFWYCFVGIRVQETDLIMILW